MNIEKCEKKMWKIFRFLEKIFSLCKRHMFVVVVSVSTNFYWSIYNRHKSGREGLKGVEVLGGYLSILNRHFLLIWARILLSNKCLKIWNKILCAIFRCAKVQQSRVPSVRELHLLLVGESSTKSEWCWTGIWRRCSSNCNASTELGPKIGAPKIFTCVNKNNKMKRNGT